MPVQFDPIPMPYTELLPHLLQNSMVAPCPMKPLEPPYPRWYDPNAKCDYHAGAIGHSTENYRALKFKVQELINAKWLNFKEDAPNVGSNPLPGHGGPSVGVIEEDVKQPLRRKIEDIKTPLRIFGSLAFSAPTVCPDNLFKFVFTMWKRDMTHPIGKGI